MTLFASLALSSVVTLSKILRFQPCFQTALLPAHRPSDPIAIPIANHSPAPALLAFVTRYSAECTSYFDPLCARQIAPDRKVFFVWLSAHSLWTWLRLASVLSLGAKMEIGKRMAYPSTGIAGDGVAELI